MHFIIFLWALVLNNNTQITGAMAPSCQTAGDKSCPDGQYCDSALICEPKKSGGEICTKNYECSSINCLNNKCEMGAVHGGTGAVPSSCSTAGDKSCPDSQYCDSALICEPKKSDGEFCTKNYECSSINCLNNKCDMSTNKCYSYGDMDSMCSNKEYCDGSMCIHKKAGGKTCYENFECETRECKKGFCSIEIECSMYSHSFPCNEKSNCRWDKGSCVDQHHKAEFEQCTNSGFDCCCGNYCGNTTTKTNICLQKCDPYNTKGDCLDTHECAQNVACKATSSCAGMTETTLGKCQPLSCKAVSEECIDDGQCCTGQCDYIDLDQNMTMRYRPRFNLESMLAPSDLDINVCGSRDIRPLSYYNGDTNSSYGTVGNNRCEKVRVCREPAVNPNHNLGPSAFEPKQHIIDISDSNKHIYKLKNGGPWAFIMFNQYQYCEDTLNTLRSEITNTGGMFFCWDDREEKLQYSNNYCEEVRCDTISSYTYSPHSGSLNSLGIYRNRLRINTTIVGTSAKVTMNGQDGYRIMPNTPYTLDVSIMEWGFYRGEEHNLITQHANDQRLCWNNDEDQYNSEDCNYCDGNGCAPVSAKKEHGGPPSLPYQASDTFFCVTQSDGLPSQVPTPNCNFDDSYFGDKSCRVGKIYKYSNAVADTAGGAAGGEAVDSFGYKLSLPVAAIPLGETHVLKIKACGEKVMGSRTKDRTYKLNGNVDNKGKGSFNEKIKITSPTVTFQYQAVTSLSICSVTDFTKCKHQNCSTGGISNLASVCNYLHTLKLAL
jgi:hypothetical protein